MKSRRSWWVIYGACAALVMGALLWITVVVIHLERSEVEARAEARHQEALRLALWRMDSWLAPRLAREAARPYYEYSSFYPQQRAYTRLLNEIEQGEVLTPSPLLSFQSDYFPLHYQVAPDGELSSPQVPGEDKPLYIVPHPPDPILGHPACPLYAFPFAVHLVRIDDAAAKVVRGVVASTPGHLVRGPRDNECDAVVLLREVTGHAGHQCVYGIYGVEVFFEDPARIVHLEITSSQAEHCG